MTGTAREKDDFQIFLERRKPVARCSCCGRFCGNFYDPTLRSFRDLNWGMVPVYLCLRRVRVDCPTCGIRVEKLSFAPLDSHLTERFRHFLGDLCRFMTRADVPFLYEVSEDIVQQCEMELLEARYRRPGRFNNLRQLRIDEIARRKGHNYLTVLVNAKNGEVVEGCSILKYQRCIN